MGCRSSFISICSAATRFLECFSWGGSSAVATRVLVLVLVPVPVLREHFTRRPRHPKQTNEWPGVPGHSTAGIAVFGIFGPFDRARPA